MTEQIPETLENEVEEWEGGDNPYDSKKVENGVGFHDPEAEVLDKLPEDHDG